MNKRSICYLAIAFCLGINLSQAQTGQSAIDTIKTNSRLWNSAFNKHDTDFYFHLVDTTIAVTAVRGTITGTQQFKSFTHRLYNSRPDITMDLNLATAEANGQWGIAYDTGDWTEAWTEKNDVSKSVIKGKYWRMWKRRNDVWQIVAIVLTPLSCSGSYCNK